MSFPLDLTGKAPTNFITRIIQRPESGVWAFKLQGGSFYTESLSVRDTFNHSELAPLTQFRVLDYNSDASYASGKEVCDIIYIVDNTVMEVIIDCQVIGGDYQVIGGDVDALIRDANLDDGSTATWGQVVSAPERYPPELHSHYVENIYGFETASFILNKVSDGISQGDNGLFTAVNQYISRKLDKLKADTSTELANLSEIATTLVSANKFQVNQIVMFTDNSDPHIVFNYGRWKRLPDGLIMMTADNSLLGVRKKVGEGDDYMATYYAAWQYLGE